MSVGVAGTSATWHALVSHPLAGLVLTLAAYELAVVLQRRLGGHVLANPVLMAIALVVIVLHLSGIRYADYMAGAGAVALVLGPATVALAVPLHTHAKQMRGSTVQLLVAAGVGAAAAAMSAVAIAWAMGAPELIVRSLAPKSVTAAIAMGVSEQIGGLPALTAAIVISTGIVGAMFGGWILNLAGIRDLRARGISIGVAAHGIGTAYALARNETEGAYAGLGMTLAGVLTGLLLPVLWHVLS